MEPKFLSERCFKNFSEQSFLQDLKQGLSNAGNTKPHSNKILKKEIMKRSNLKNIANKSGKIEDKKRYKIQRNVATKLNKKL